MYYLATNREAWDKRTKIHVSSNFYNVKSFEEGSTSLRDIELSELKNVSGKTLLHLQCHFGLDTLSWARKGAIVTGVDFSPESINQAQYLSKKLGINSEFICTDVYSYTIPQDREKFDIVYTSYGVICWLPSLSKWAKIVSNSLKKGGTFYMVEFHPTFGLYEGESYFHSSVPDESEEGTYTDGVNHEKSKMLTWSHSLSDVVNALINEGLTIKHLNEFPFSPYNCFEGLVEREQGHYYKPFNEHDLPLTYSIYATKNT